MNVHWLRGRNGVLVYEIVVLVVMLGGAAVWLTGHHIQWIPEKFGPMPVGVPFFGALGAVLISLTGVFEHRKDWDNSWNAWHYTRWLVGITVAIVAYLIVRAGVLSLQITAENDSGTHPKNFFLYYVVAFAVGFREATFRDLLRKLFEVIFSTDKPAPGITGVYPDTASGGATIAITGTNLTPALAIKFGTLTAQMTPGSTNTETALSVTVPANPGFSGDVPLIVQTGNGAAATTFTYR